MGGFYARSGAEVRFNPSVLISDARYMCADGKFVLVGVPERTGRNEPTRKGYSIPSESVCGLFTKEFETHWDAPESKAYDSYLKELVGRARASNPTASPELIAANLRIEREDVVATLTILGEGPP
jgi:hypothetical protein